MRRHYWPLLLFASALVIRLIGIGSESLWYDEAFTANLVKLPIANLIQATAGDVHPPAWYLITWVFSQVLGNSEWALRLPSALASAASVAETYLLIRNMVDHRAGLWAAGITIIAAGMQYYGQESRQYSFLTWLTLSSLRSVVEDRKWRFMPTMALALYTHNLAPIYWLPLGGLALFKWRKQALLPLGLAAGSYLPWAAVLIRQISDVGASYWIAPDNAGGMLWYMVYGTLGGRVPAWLQFHGMATAIGITFASVAAMRTQWRKYIPLFALSFLPPMELYGISQVWQPMMLPRALLPSSAGVLSLWGVGLSKMPKWGRNFAMLCLVPIMAITFINYYTDPTVRRVPASDQTQIITGNWQPGDVIYHASVGSVVGYDYYLHDYPFALMPGGDEIGGLSVQTRAALGYTAHEAPITALALHYKRAFVVWSKSPTISDQQVGRTEAILARYPIIKAWVLVDKPLAYYAIDLIDLRGDYASTQ